MNKHLFIFIFFLLVFIPKESFSEYFNPASQKIEQEEKLVILKKYVFPGGLGSPRSPGAIFIWLSDNSLYAIQPELANTLNENEPISKNVLQWPTANPIRQNSKYERLYYILPPDDAAGKILFNQGILFLDNGSAWKTNGLQAGWKINDPVFFSSSPNETPESTSPTLTLHNIRTATSSVVTFMGFNNFSRFDSNPIGSKLYFNGYGSFPPILVADGYKISGEFRTVGTIGKGMTFTQYFDPKEVVNGEGGSATADWGTDIPILRAVSEKDPMNTVFLTLPDLKAMEVSSEG